MIWREEKRIATILNVSKEGVNRKESLETRVIHLSPARTFVLSFVSVIVKEQTYSYRSAVRLHALQFLTCGRI
jgi:hypothetical protein